MINRLGKYTVEFGDAPSITGYGSVAGKKEYEGPLSDRFDKIFFDPRAGQKTFEKAEILFQQEALTAALGRANKKAEEIDFVFAGDLLNQCISSSYGMKEFRAPYLGQYGACSTMAQTLFLAALTVSSGASSLSAAVTSSHFCTAERQYRMPLEYGGQRTTTAQWTVTGSGACLIEKVDKGPKIAKATIGKITDLGIKDANNMGAAMAPAICIIEPYPMLKNAGCIYVFTIILQKRRFLLQIAAETIKWIFRVNLTSTGGIKCQRKFQPKTRDITYRRTTMNCPN